MRKGKRFNPARLARWQANGRGLGIKEDYVPWHQVTRDDPGSRGRSHLVNWRFGRQHHLLSDQELVVFGLITMLSGVEDVREQFPLAHKTHLNELAAYQWPPSKSQVPGTLEIAADLGLKHPRTSGDGATENWVMTTDFLLTLKMPNLHPALLAISVKADDELENQRTLALLRIEREYWRRQDCIWLLITPSMYGEAIDATVKSALAWALYDGYDDNWMMLQMLRLSQLASSLNGLLFRVAIQKVQDELAVDRDTAQRLFWQAVWMGVILLDLSIPLRPSSRLRLVSREQFTTQNPIAGRRTAWKL